MSYFSSRRYRRSAGPWNREDTAGPSWCPVEEHVAVWWFRLLFP